ncbi:hypothetical protein [Paraburkholderia strydomiana]|uniref:hypothetical protein n=1 Tax=Paraburkholderia strydomiana TaxID=1245417 RepID=UPI0038B86008
MPEMLPHATINLIATRCHLALQAMSNSSGTSSTARTLLEVTIATSVLAELGYGAVSEVTARDAEDAVRRSVESGLATGRWHLDEVGAHAICRIVEVFEAQLASAPASDVEAAFTTVKKLGVG